MIQLSFEATSLRHIIEKNSNGNINGISVRQGDAGDAVASPTMKNWPFFGQKFSKFGQSIQLHSHSM